MTSLSIDATRSELVADLNAGGFLATEQLDGQVTPPAVVIACGNPYITAATDTLRRDEVQLSLDLFVIFRPAQREAWTRAVDRAVQDVLLAIDDRWSFREASAPFRATNLSGLPACRIRISTTALLTEGT